MWKQIIFYSVILVIVGAIGFLSVEHYSDGGASYSMTANKGKTTRDAQRFGFTNDWANR